MTGSQAITDELDFGEVISRTFGLLREDFLKYFAVFAVIEVVIDVITQWANDTLLKPYVTSASQGTLTSGDLSAFLGALGEFLLTTVLLTVIVGTVAYAFAVRISSQRVTGGTPDVSTSLAAIFPKFPYIWIAWLLSFCAIFLGVIALVVPGIILGIMFSLALPAIVVEGRGPLDGMSRSRELVSQRWLKSFAVYLVMGIILAVVSEVGNAIASLFGAATPVAQGIISALYTPLLPILLTVYFYSNVARLTPSPPPEAAPPARSPAPGPS
jgi:hypothetical protein